MTGTLRGKPDGGGWKGNSLSRISYSSFENHLLSRFNIMALGCCIVSGLSSDGYTFHPFFFFINTAISLCPGHGSSSTQTKLLILCICENG